MRNEARMPISAAVYVNVSRDICVPEVEIEERFDDYRSALLAEQQRLGILLCVWDERLTLP